MGVNAEQERYQAGEKAQKAERERCCMNWATKEKGPQGESGKKKGSREKGGHAEKTSIVGGMPHGLPFH